MFRVTNAVTINKQKIESEIIGLKLIEKVKTQLNFSENPLSVYAVSIVSISKTRPYRK